MTTPTELGPDLPLTDAEVLAALVGLERWDDLARAGAVPSVDLALVERIASSVAAAAPAGPRAGRARREPGPSVRRRGRWYVAVAALAAAVTAAVVVVPTLGDRPPAVAEASVLLDRAAAATADPVAGPGQWWRVTSTMIGLGVANGEQSTPPRVYRIASTDVRYVPIDGAGPGYLVAGARRYLAQVSGPAGPLPGPDAASVQLEQAGPTATDDPWASPTADWLSSLPRDPASLRAALASFGPGRTGGDAVTALAHASTVLESGLASADLRRAVLQALSGYGTALEVVRGVSLGGRAGVAVGAADTDPSDPGSRAVTPEQGTLTQLVLDPSSGELLGTRVTTVGDTGLGVASGSVLLERRVVRALVDSVPEDVLRRASAAGSP